MLFNSLDFILFFSIVVLLFWVMRQKHRWVLLLAASYFFYLSWEPAYIILILFSTSIDYFACRYLTGTDNMRKKKIGLTLSIVLNLGLLFAFKYYNFLQSALQDLFGLFDISYSPVISDFLLPVGISFYTFQTISYSIDVYRGELKAEKHLGKFALYVSFFPQLIAGPIERAKDLLTQFNTKEHYFKVHQFKEGVTLFVWGLFKKVVVADNAQIIADHFFNNAEFQTGGTLFFATFMFTIQIYADFSGYSDMAIGTAKILGIDLSMNFRTPYFSQSITEFWKRWHITLSSWLRDYVYIPLGGNKKGKAKHLRNLFITFFLAGVWHGASWNFIIWGVMHGVLIVIEKLLKLDKGSKNFLLKNTRIALNFLVIMITMIPVRTSTSEEMTTVFNSVFHLNPSDVLQVFIEYKLSAALLGTTFLLLIDWFVAKNSITTILSKNIFVRYVWFVLVILFILLSGDTDGDAFFYFQF